jgi:hypothetical protein
VVSYDHNQWGHEIANNVAVPSILQNGTKRSDSLLMRDREMDKLGWKILTLT